MQIQEQPLIRRQSRSLGLPARKQVFVEQYLIDLKARDAAIRTGYAVKSAHVTASRLLAEPKVRKAISAELVTRFDVSKESIIDELAALAFANLGDYYDWTGGEIRVKPSRKLTAQQKKAVTSVRRVNGADGGIVQLRIANQLKALELLAKLLGMMDNKHARKR
ncbi:MAG: terminase small subunit [Alphaproteobacteria bacterium]|nr:terminase small subunit [Alphaproteobacteria bacterium]